MNSTFGSNHRWITLLSNIVSRFTDLSSKLKPHSAAL